MTPKKWLQLEERAIQMAVQVATQRIAEAHGVDAGIARAIAGNVAMAVPEALLDLAESTEPTCECCGRIMRASYSTAHAWHCSCGHTRFVVPHECKLDPFRLDARTSSPAVPPLSSERIGDDT